MWIKSCILLAVASFQALSILTSEPSVSHIPGSRRYYIGTEKVTCTQAAVLCRRKSMQIVSIRNEKENNDIFTFLSQQELRGSFHTSGRKLNYINSWIWWDDEPVEYFNWNQGEPSGAVGSDSCISISIVDDAVKWFEQSAAMKSYYLCESIENECNTFMTEDGFCTHKKKDRQKYFLGTKPLQYYEAFEYCEQMYMQLATVENTEDNAAVYRLMRLRGRRSGFWIAANQQPDSDNWKWLDGKLVEYFNWNEGCSSKIQDAEKCIVLFKKGQSVKWVDSSCDAVHPALCEKTDPSVKIYVNRKKVFSNDLKFHSGRTHVVEVFLNLHSDNYLLGWNVLRNNLF